MLSKDLSNLYERFIAYTHGGLTMSGREVEFLTNIFRDCEDRAIQLELAQIPVPLTLNAAHLDSGKVLVFPIIPRPRQEEDEAAS